MDQNLMLVLLILLLFFVYSQYYTDESFGGTSWFPRSYLKYIRNTMEKFTNNGNNDADMGYALESPNFAKYDLGNQFVPSKNDVDSVYFDQIKNVDPIASNSLFHQNSVSAPSSILHDDMTTDNDYNMSRMNIITDEILYKRGGNASTGQWYNT